MARIWRTEFLGSAVETLSQLILFNSLLNLNLNIQTKCKNPKSENFCKNWVYLLWLLLSSDGILLVLDAGNVVEAGPQCLQLSSSKHKQDVLVEEGHPGVIAVFAWKGGSLFNQAIYEP